MHARPLRRQQLHVRQRPPGRVREPREVRRPQGRDRDGRRRWRDARRARGVRGYGGEARFRKVGRRRAPGTEHDPVGGAVPAGGHVPGRTPARQHGPRSGSRADVLPHLGAPRRLAGDRRAHRLQQDASGDRRRVSRHRRGGEGRRRSGRICLVDFAAPGAGGPRSGRTTAATRRWRGPTWRPASSTQPSSGRARQGSTTTRACRRAKRRACRRLRRAWSSAIPRPGDFADRGPQTS